MTTINLDDLRSALAAGSPINPAIVRDLADFAQETGERNRVLEDRCESLNEQVRAMAAPCISDDEKEDEEKATMEAFAICFEALRHLPRHASARVLHATGILCGLKPNG